MLSALAEAKLSIDRLHHEWEKSALLDRVNAPPPGVPAPANTSAKWQAKLNAEAQHVMVGNGRTIFDNGRRLVTPRVFEYESSGGLTPLTSSSQAALLGPTASVSWRDEAGIARRNDADECAARARTNHRFR